MTSNGLAYIFHLIASGKIKCVDDGRRHYYRVLAKEITKEELDELKNKERFAKDHANETTGMEQSGGLIDKKGEKK